MNCIFFQSSFIGITYKIVISTELFLINSITEGNDLPVCIFATEVTYLSQRAVTGMFSCLS